MRLIWVLAGSLFLGIGIAGVVLPMMPGTVFLFVASFCFLRGSERLHRWLMGHPVLGRQVRTMTGEIPMTRRAKVTAIGSMWIAVAISVTAMESWPLQALFVGLAAFGTWFIAVRR